MRLALTLAAVAIATAAFAQDATPTIRESAVEVSGARLAFLADGGCTLQPEVVSPRVAALPDGGVELVQPAPRAFNGARCTISKAAVLRAAKLDVGVGDGTAP